MKHRGSFSLGFFICVMESTLVTKLRGKHIFKPKKYPTEPQALDPPKPNQPNGELIIYCLIVPA